MKLYAIFLILFIITSSTNISAQQANNRPAAGSFANLIITTPPPELGLDTFYQKYADAFGIPVVSSINVSAEALLVARDIVNYMLLARPDIRAELVAQGARLSIIGQHEMQTDLPECREWKKPEKSDPRLTPSERENYDKPGGIASMTDKQYWNQRARGMGGLHTSCAEENLLGIKGTRYFGENITVHEFSHNIMQALGHTDSALFQRIKDAYEKAKTKGLYKGQYAINTVAEYWAEGTQWWFWSNFEFYDGDKRIQTPDDLQQYDPELFEILSHIYAGHHIPADVYWGKNWNSKVGRK